MLPDFRLDEIWNSLLSLFLGFVELTMYPYNPRHGV
jgi:hypothetical protein